tara:strand:- start:225 stop:449 length:225 start_codon:yes stop_codon:yes gene_type:complete
MAREKLREAIGRQRRALKIQQGDLAAAVGVSNGCWSRHENGQCEMSLTQALNALQALGCSVLVADQNGELVWEG